VHGADRDGPLTATSATGSGAACMCHRAYSLSAAHQQGEIQPTRRQPTRLRVPPLPADWVLCASALSASHKAQWKSRSFGATSDESKRQTTSISASDHTILTSIHSSVYPHSDRPHWRSPLPELHHSLSPILHWPPGLGCCCYHTPRKFATPPRRGYGVERLQLCWVAGIFAPSVVMARGVCPRLPAVTNQNLDGHGRNPL